MLTAGAGDNDPFSANLKIQNPDSSGNPNACLRPAGVPRDPLAGTDIHAAGCCRNDRQKNRFVL